MVVISRQQLLHLKNARLRGLTYVSHEAMQQLAQTARKEVVRIFQFAQR